MGILQLILISFKDYLGHKVLLFVLTIFFFFLENVNTSSLISYCIIINYHGLAGVLVTACSKTEGREVA